MKNYILIIISFLVIKTGISQEYKNQVKNNNRFTFELFSGLSNEKENLFLSPFSVSTTLAMVYEGARNKTRAEMAKTLHFPDDSEVLHKNFKDLISDTQKSNNDKFYTFNIANSIWAQKDFNFLHTFFSAANNYYNAKIESVNFKTAKEREITCKKINDWTARKTNNKIKDLLNVSSLDKDTKTVLVNAVYFLAQWDKIFNKDLTKQDIFYGLSGYKKKDFMHTEKRMRYAEKNNIKFLEIPYKSQKASLIILMPDTSVSIDDLLKKIDYSFYDELYKKAEYKNIKLSLPKFKIEYKNDLAKPLYKAGMRKAFTNSADFSGITCKKELRIDKIIHQTFIKIDESGTEAAAATAVVMKRITSINPSKIIEFKADHPFIFLIRENATGSILFIGQLIN